MSKILYFWANLVKQIVEIRTTEPNNLPEVVIFLKSVLGEISEKI